MSTNLLDTDEDGRPDNVESTRPASTEEGTRPFPHDGREAQNVVSPTVLNVGDGDDDEQALPPPPPIGGLVRGRNLPAQSPLVNGPSPPALRRAPHTTTARARLDDDEEEEDVNPAPSLALVQSPRTPPDGFSRLLVSTSVSSLSPIPSPPFPSSNEIALATPPRAPASSSRTESWASDATPPPPILGRSGSSQNRVMWRTGVDVDSFIGTGESSSSSEADDAESLIARMRSISELNNSSDAVTAGTPPTLSPKESSSSVEKESLSGSVGGADVLTESELPAIVSPELRRHSSSSSPGAYHANGSTAGVSPERFTSPRFHSLTPPSLRSTVALTTPELQSSSSGGPLPTPPLSQADSCTTLVSATVVDEFSETEQSYSVSQHQHGHMGGAGCGNPMMEHLPYAHAEPLQKKIRPKCVAAWLVLLAITISISTYLGTWFAGVTTSNQSETSISSSNAVNETNSSSIAPTAAPLAELMTDVNQETSSHVVMWGQLTTCNDTDFFTAYPLELKCGGTILIQEQVNAECTNAALPGHANISDVSRMVCRFQEPEPPTTESGSFYQQATAHVIYNCVGESFNDHSGTASLPSMEVSGCGQTLEDDNPGRQRLLRSVAARVSASPETDYTRALQDAVQVGASSFITVGRFCSENDGQKWLLWHQFYRCERGKRMFFTNLSDALNSPNPPQDWESLLDWLIDWVSPETAAGASVPDPTNLILNLLASQNNGGRNRRQRRLAEILSSFSIWDLLNDFGVKNVCHSTDVEQCSRFCGVDASGGPVCPTCTARVAPVQASDYDARDACRQSGQGPTLGQMKRLVDDSLSSKIFTDRMAALI